MTERTGRALTAPLSVFPLARIRDAGNKSLESFACARSRLRAPPRLLDADAERASGVRRLRDLVPEHTDGAASLTANEAVDREFGDSAQVCFARFLGRTCRRPLEPRFESIQETVEGLLELDRRFLGHGARQGAVYQAWTRASSLLYPTASLARVLSPPVSTGRTDGQGC